MTDVISIFTPIIGQMAWGIHRTHGSAFFMEFGRPHLQVHNPKKASPDASPKVAENMAKRGVYPHGEWSLLALYGPWKMATFGKACAWEDNDQKMAEVFRFMDGQKLLTIHMSNDQQFTMTFDLGGELRMNLSPQVLEGDAWSLSDRSAGTITTYKEDGNIIIGSGRAGQPGEIVTRKNSKN